MSPPSVIAGMLRAVLNVVPGFVTIFGQANVGRPGLPVRASLRDFKGSRTWRSLAPLTPTAHRTAPAML